MSITQCSRPNQKRDNAPRGAECSIQTEKGMELDCLAAVAKHSSWRCGASLEK